MKKAIQTTLIFGLLLFNIFNCYSQNSNKLKDEKVSLLKAKLDLKDNQISEIIKNDTIVNELFLSLKDTTKLENVKRRLNAFLVGKYNSKKLLLALKLERLFEKGSFEFTDNIDTAKVRHFKDVNKFSTFIKKSEEEIEKELNKSKERDSTKNKQ